VRKNLPVTEKNIPLSNETNIFSVTNLKGQIKYTNQTFIDIAGFSQEELENQPHNIIRHPFMPSAAFKTMWGRLKSGNSWMGLVKNRTKAGDHYWVDAYATPIMGVDDKPTEYQSVRVKPENAYVDRANQIYSELNAGKKNKKIGDSKLRLSTKWIMLLSIPLIALISFLLLSSDMPPIYLISVGAVALIVQSLLAIFLFNPFNQLVNESYKKYSDPLARYIYTGRSDDLGQIMLQLKQVDTEGGAIIGRISEDCQQMMSGITQLNTNVQQNVTSLRSLYEDNELVATATEQMSASVQEVASNIQNTSKAAELANKNAINTGLSVKKTVDSIKELSEEINNSSQVIQQLGQDSENINGMVDVIKSVAEQTNLLALNAAIEAARAGDQGRGFAVVADEVRTLANRTHESTEEIMQMVGKLRDAAQQAVSSMELASKKTDETVDNIGEVSSTIDTIVDSIDSISQMSVQIATASDEQSSVAHSISENVTNIKYKSGEILSTSENNERVSSQVFTTSSNLYELSRQFWKKKRKQN